VLPDPGCTVKLLLPTLSIPAISVLPFAPVTTKFPEPTFKFVPFTASIPPTVVFPLVVTLATSTALVVWLINTALSLACKSPLNAPATNVS